MIRLLLLVLMLMGSSGNGQDPSKYCTTCNKTITTNPSGTESGHADDCEWNPKNQ